MYGLVYLFDENSEIWDFPGSLVVKDQPSNAGDTDSIASLWRPHMQQSNWAHAPQLLKPTPQICRWHHPYGRKWRGTKKPLDESEKWRVKKLA